MFDTTSGLSDSNQQSLDRAMTSGLITSRESGRKSSMGNERSPDPGSKSKESTLLDDAQAYVDSARKLELMALDLAQRNVDVAVAIGELIEATGGEVRVMRRAHRNCERALSDQWPAGQTLIRAFDYLSAGRREMKNNGSHPRRDVPKPAPRVRTNRRSDSTDRIYDLVDKASIESFPASDAPSFWAR